MKFKIGTKLSTDPFGEPLIIIVDVNYEKSWYVIKELNKNYYATTWDIAVTDRIWYEAMPESIKNSPLLKALNEL